jgi:hypothetical protein
VATAELQMVALSALRTQEETICFWLNIYHTMILHAHAANGFTETANRGYSYWQRVKYNIGFHRFSLIQVEHAVLRANLSSPDIIGVSLVLPKFKGSDPRAAFVVTQKEPAIGLVLNCGGAMGCAPIAVYTPNSLHVQLRNTVVAYLQVCMLQHLMMNWMMMNWMMMIWMMAMTST